MLLSVAACLPRWGGGQAICEDDPQKEWPLWDGQETVVSYAHRVGLEPTKTIDLGNGVTMEFVLIPAGKFIMGTPEAELVNEGAFRERILVTQAILAMSVGTMLVLLGVVVIRAVRDRRWPRYSLARFIVMILVLGAGVGGATRWYVAHRELGLERLEYAAAKSRFAEAHSWEKPAHAVTIKQPFYFGKYEVTQEQYQQVRGCNPSLYKGATLPVGDVVLGAAQDFCSKLRAKTGIMIRLPTDPEWEYACRAGTRTRFCSGDSEKDLDSVAWYGGNSSADEGPHKVGQKQPNAWGLYDMHGNIVEQTYDLDEYSEDIVALLNDKEAYDLRRLPVLRGGNWASPPEYCRSADRYKVPPAKDRGSGFRVVLMP